MTVNAMVFLDVHHVVIHGFIVTEATRIASALADWIWALQLTSPQVVLAAQLTSLKDQFS